MRKYVVLPIAIVSGLLIGLFIEPLFSGDNVFEQIKKIDKVLNTAVKNYVEEVDPQKLTEAAIKGMLGELDVHSVYISAEEMKGVNEDFQGNFEGIGVEFDMINDSLTVVSPIVGGPSEQAGIQSGDKIVKVDGENVVGISRSDVPKKLKGPKGTQVVLDVKRSGKKDLLTFTITRDKIPLNSIEGKFMIDGSDIGVVEVNRFSQTTYDELIQALRELKTQGMKKLILDLRGNPGGYLNQAQYVADEFLPGGDTIVYTIGRKPEFNEVYTAVPGNEFENIPLIIMINEGSASASEIVSGSIQDHDRGLIVGETSFGKGLVQRQYPIGDGSAFRLTIAKYYTPSGRCIQRPFKDKDKYRHLVGRFEPEDGDYVYDGYDKIKKQLAKLNDTTKNAKDKIDFASLPLFKTEHGRTVFGGGGITPDYIVKTDTITRMSAEIRGKRLFFEFADYLIKAENLKEKYGNDYEAFLHKFKLSDANMKAFKNLCEKKEIKWDEKSADVDEEFYELSIKATIARSLWDRNKFLQIFSLMDKQVKKAVELFPQAEKIMKMKKVSK